MGETMESADNAAFWLPTHFLTDDDLLPPDDVDPRCLKKDPTRDFDLFSNGFDPFGPHSVLDSPVSSTETDNDNDDELLAELTRQLAHSTLQDNHSHNPSESWMFSTSPQSTLSGFGPWTNRSGFSSNGSPNGPSQVPSPPLTPPGPKNDAAWELLYEAAGQVARLKMNAMAAQLNQQQQQNRGLLGAPRHLPSLSSNTTKSHHLNALYDFSHSHQFQQVKRQSSGMWGQGSCQHHNHHQQRRSCGGALGLPQSAWPPLRTEQQPQHHHQHNPRGPGMRSVFIGGSGHGVGPAPPVKRQSTGTGVFIPRRVGTPQHHQPELRKKPTVLLPARVVQALNLDLEEMNNGVNFNSNSRLGSGFVTNHDILMARRNALLNQHRRSLRPETMAAAGHDIRLPSDWTY